jgi:LAO/AO transport system kinase
MASTISANERSAACKAVSQSREQTAGAGLLEAACAGDRRALAELLSRVERGGDAGRDAAASALASGRSGYTVGLTGAPGAGKSTLTDGIIEQARERQERIAVLAVDPSSPLTGGAILGDRVRLREGHARDDGVFVRSLASRGQLGGLARAVPDAISVLGAAGWAWILLETVGVGQSELEVATQADTTIVVLTPGWGDEIQANKAGLLEVADVLVVNKADLPGANASVKHLKGMLALTEQRSWVPPIVQTSAVDGVGLGELWTAIETHRDHLLIGDQLDRRRAARRLAGFRAQVASATAAATSSAERSPEGRKLLEAVAAGSVDPASAVLDLVRLMRAQTVDGD